MKSAMSRRRLSGVARDAEKREAVLGKEAGEGHGAEAYNVKSRSCCLLLAPSCMFWTKTVTVREGVEEVQ